MPLQVQLRRFREIAPSCAPANIVHPEVTATMLEAGRRVIAEELGICSSDIAPELARDVFVTMWDAHRVEIDQS
jgi:hypothetical protein